jgi:glutaredoxin
MYTTPKRCPKCRYERQSSDTAPDWQCPSCGIAYSKAESPLPGQPPPVARPRGGSGSASSGGAAKWIVTILCVVGIYALYARPWQQSMADHRPAGVAKASTAQPEVIMYATSWCPYCKQARSFFSRHGIVYVEYDVEHNGKAWRENKRLGGGGVPTIVVGDEVVSGFSEHQLIKLLGPWMD